MNKVHLQCTFLIMVFFLVLNINAVERKSALWGDLEPGPYAVGFKLVTVLDHSRVFHSNAAFRGLAEDAEKTRALRIYIWYPAQAVQERLRLHDYARMAAEDFNAIPAAGSPAGKNSVCRFRWLRASGMKNGAPCCRKKALPAWKPRR